MLRVLLTTRLVLRPIADSDLEIIIDLWNTPGVNKFLFDAQPVSLDSARVLLQRLNAGNGRGLGLWAVRQKGAPAIVGTAGIAEVTSVAEFEPAMEGQVEPIVALREDLWGQRLGSEILARLTEYAWSDLRLTQMVAAVDVGNDVSERLITSAGFRQFSEVPGPAGKLRTFIIRRESHVD